jgi:ABC-type multidrug transport system fused ATPase/permease subunit
MNAQSITPGLVVSRVWEIYRAQFGVLVGVAAVLFAIQFVVYLVLSASASIALTVLFVALSVLYQGMVVKLVQDIQDGRRDHSAGELLRSVEPVFWQLLAVSLLAGIGIAIGFVLLIIPGLMLMVLWAVVAPVTVLERPGVFAAFGRSRDLVRGNGWNVFGVLVIVFVAVIVISFVAGFASDSLGSVARSLVQWLVNSAVAPLAALSASVLYFALHPSSSYSATGRVTPTDTPEVP